MELQLLQGNHQDEMCLYPQLEVQVVAGLQVIYCCFAKKIKIELQIELIKVRISMCPLGQRYLHYLEIDQAKESTETYLI